MTPALKIQRNTSNLLLCKTGRSRGHTCFIYQMLDALKLFQAKVCICDLNVQNLSFCYVSVRKTLKGTKQF